MGFYQLEIIQFLIGLLIVIASYIFIIHHRKPLLDYEAPALCFGCHKGKKGMG